jgi:hypothetical protein
MLILKFEPFYYIFLFPGFLSLEKLKYVSNPFKGKEARYLLSLRLLVRLGGYIANLSDFYSYRLIGKLTAFLQLQQ